MTLPGAMHDQSIDLTPLCVQRSTSDLSARPFCKAFLQPVKPYLSEMPVEVWAHHK